MPYAGGSFGRYRPRLAGQAAFQTQPFGAGSGGPTPQQQQPSTGIAPGQSAPMPSPVQQSATTGDAFITNALLTGGGNVQKLPISPGLEREPIQPTAPDVQNAQPPSAPGVPQAPVGYNPMQEAQTQVGNPFLQQSMLGDSFLQQSMLGNPMQGIGSVSNPMPQAPRISFNAQSARPNYRGYAQRQAGAFGQAGAAQRRKMGRMRGAGGQRGQQFDMRNILRNFRRRRRGMVGIA